MPNDLNYFVPFLMYRVMAKGLRQATSDYARLGLSVPEARVMIVLSQHRDRIRAGALAETTCIEPSALSHILRRLSRAGLITRERVHSDNRSVEVVLTAAGRRTAQACLAASRTHERVLLKRFQPAERDALRHALLRMYENVAAWPSNGDVLALQPTRRASAKTRKPRAAK